MNTTAPAVLNLARRLIAMEALAAPSDGLVGPAVQVCDKLRVPLAKLAGLAGFRSLMTRAKALATSEIPWLESVQVQEDGSLQDFESAGHRQAMPQGLEAGVVIVSQLLGLLVTFIGEPLTLQLVRGAWPEASMTEMDAGTEKTS